MNTIILDEKQVSQYLDMQELINEMENGLINFSKRLFIQPVRSILPVDKYNGFLGIMPAYCGEMGIKLVTVYNNNLEKGLPTHNAIIVLFEPDTGIPKAVLDGRLITEKRTAAVSAVATKYLADPNAKILAIIGSGVQAHSHFEALKLVRDFKEVRVYSPNNAKKFAVEINGTACNSPEEAVKNADVIVVATSATSPVLYGKWIKNGAHVNAVGACRPDQRELDDEVMKNIIYVDSIEGAMKESGDIILSHSTIHAEIGEALAGIKTLEVSKTTVFKSLGMAIEDVLSANAVIRNYQAIKK